ncbi:MAG: hypothetical protein JNJ91_10600 [Flavobacteriales bacterium]|nr:hypothetical protein [Flavobacteriales bacterium]
MEKTFPNPDSQRLLHTLQVFEDMAGRLSGADVQVIPCRIAVHSVISIGKVCARAWPVQLSDSQSRQLVQVVSECTQEVQQVLNGRNNLAMLTTVLNQAHDTLQDLRVQFIVSESVKPADAYAELLVKQQEKVLALDGLINNLTGLANNQINKKTLEEQSNYFSEQAKRFWRIAGICLITFSTLSVLFVAFLCSMLGSQNYVTDLFATEVPLEVNMNRLRGSCPDCVRTFFLNALIKTHAIRVLTVSFFLFLIAVVLKAFNSAAHNYTINMQRSNSLRAALQMLEKSHSEDAKDAMMDKAAAAIFSHQPTGFNTKPPANLVQNVMEWGKSHKDGE